LHSGVAALTAHFGLSYLYPFEGSFFLLSRTVKRKTNPLAINNKNNNKNAAMAAIARQEITVKIIRLIPYIVVRGER
jgi:hypothetical protein